MSAGLLAQTQLKNYFLPVKAYFILATDTKCSKKRCFADRVDINSDLNQVGAEL